MNMKEAFRFQNKLVALMDEVVEALTTPENITRRENTHLRSKVMPDAADETVTEIPSFEFSDKITELAEFGMDLLNEREKLSAAIYAAKIGLGMDFDSAASLNKARHHLNAAFSRMVDLRSSEVILPHGGTGYRFNVDGNQVAYKCPLKRVTSINYDRKVIRRSFSSLNKTMDEVSTRLDLALINSAVDYTPPFDVNDSFAEIFEEYCGKQ